MIDSIFKRVIAYLIDVMLVSIVVSSVVSSSVVNFQLSKYKEVYNEYNEVYTLYLEQYNNDIKNCDDLEKAINDKKITEKKYVDEFENLKKTDLEEDEYGNKCSIIVESYNNNKMTSDYYTEKVDNYYYLLQRNSIVAYIVNILVCLLYFVFFQGFTGGQTLGKKIMRLKVVSTKGEEKVSYKQLFIRTMFLPVDTTLNNVLYFVIMIFATLLLPKNIFISVTNFLYFLNYLISLVIVFTIAFNKGKVGLHDIIAHTRIMEMDFKGNEIKEKEKKVKNKEEIIKEKDKKVEKNKDEKR